MGNDREQGPCQPDCLTDVTIGGPLVISSTARFHDPFPSPPFGGFSPVARPLGRRGDRSRAGRAGRPTPEGLHHRPLRVAGGAGPLRGRSASDRPQRLRRHPGPPCGRRRPRGERGNAAAGIGARHRGQPRAARGLPGGDRGLPSRAARGVGGAARQDRGRSRRPRRVRARERVAGGNVAERDDRGPAAQGQRDRASPGRRDPRRERGPGSRPIELGRHHGLRGRYGGLEPASSRRAAGTSR